MNGIKGNQGADYMVISNPDWNFNSVFRIEISSRLNSKLLCKMTLQLHVKTELKFQLGSANPRWNFNPGWKVLLFHIIDIFPTRDENLVLRTREFLGYFQKIKMATSQARFKWTDDRRLQEFKCSMEFRNCDSNADKVKLYESVRKSLNRYI